MVDTLDSVSILSLIYLFKLNPHRMGSKTVFNKVLLSRFTGPEQSQNSPIVFSMLGSVSCIFLWGVSGNNVPEFSITQEHNHFPLPQQVIGAIEFYARSWKCNLHITLLGHNKWGFWWWWGEDGGTVCNAGTSSDRLQGLSHVERTGLVNKE